MERLPAEIVLKIFILATADDRKTASELCLVNQATQSIVAPLLYKHVCLSGTDQVRRFNASFKLLRPKTQRLIQGMTLLDTKLALIEVEEREYYLDDEAQRKGGWIKHWKDLVRYIGHLSRMHRLCTLVVLDEVEARFRYEDQQCKEPLAKQLSESNLRLSHLVLSHADIEFFLSKLQTEKLTWYGCEMHLAKDPLDVVFNKTKLRSRQMREVCIFLGANLEYMRSKTEAKEPEDTDRGWDTVFVRQLGEICKTQQRKPSFKVLLHQKTQESVQDLTNMVSGLDFNVSMGLWGKPSDTSQREAELESMADEGWIARVPLRYIDAPEEVGDEDPSQPIQTGNWTMRRPPGKQWCCCFDLEPVRMAMMDANRGLDDWEESDDDDYDDDNYGYGDGGYWSDDSANWNPMQRMAFLSGESHHYSQAYLDEWAL